jgi:hypothetical protein
MSKKTKKLKKQIKALEELLALCSDRVTVDTNDLHRAIFGAAIAGPTNPPSISIPESKDMKDYFKFIISPPPLVTEWYANFTLPIHEGVYQRSISSLMKPIYSYFDGEKFYQHSSTLEGALNHFKAKIVSPIKELPWRGLKNKQ